MVLVEPVGAANAYRLNREHLLVAPALEMLHTLDRLETQLGTAIRSWPVPCAGCALFGSAARRDGSTRSDLDVLVLRPNHIAVDDPSWRTQLDDTASQAHRWTGNPLSWVEFDTDTFTRLIATADPLIGELRRDAHWLLRSHPGPRTRRVRRRAAVGLLATVHPEGPDLAKSLRIALDAKDPMHHATDYLTPDRHTAVLGAATTLATAAQRMLPPMP